MAVWAKNMEVFGKENWGGFWRVLAPKVAVSDLELLETLATWYSEDSRLRNRRTMEWNPISKPEN